MFETLTSNILCENFESIQKELDKHKNEIIFSFLKNGVNLATMQNQKGVADIMRVLGWYNDSVKMYTSVVESKLMGLVSGCLKNQATLEEKLKNSFEEIKKLEEINQSLNLKIKELENEIYQKALYDKSQLEKNKQYLPDEQNPLKNTSNVTIAIKKEIEDPSYGLQKSLSTSRNLNEINESNDCFGDFNDDNQCDDIVEITIAESEMDEFEATAKKIKEKLNINDEIDDEPEYEKYLDAELVGELFLTYIKEKGVSRTEFAKYIVKATMPTFDLQVRNCQSWHGRSVRVQKLFHKLKKVLAKTPYSETMKRIESTIYKKRIDSLIHHLESSNISRESFAEKQLQISADDFEKLIDNCLKIVPLNEASKKHLTTISEFVINKLNEIRKDTNKFLKPIKDREGLLALLENLKISLKKEHVTKLDFSKFILNRPVRYFDKILCLEREKTKKQNVVLINAIYNWLKDENRLEKLEQAKKTGEFFYLDCENISEDVLKFFTFV